jgi:SAM-dependent methyltransferase
MEAAAERAAAIRTQVRGEWDDDVTVQAWRRWHAPFSRQTAAVTEALVEAARLEPGMRVLDLASGSGQPAILLARAVGAEGRVTATDVSEGMLVSSRENAAAAGVENMDFRRADAEELPFEDGSFDVATCRFGVMFFSPVVGALEEVRRVLRPDGRIALVAWGPVTQPWFASTVGVVLRHLDPPPPPPPPDAPTPFRFAEPGSLTAVLEQAGFSEVEEDRRTVPLPWPGSAEEAWEHVSGIAAPFRAMLAALGERRAQTEAEIVETLRTYDRDGTLEMDGEIVIVTGRAG